jgi:DNA-binding transcriptional ArsR family regulator
MRPLTGRPSRTVVEPDQEDAIFAALADRTRRRVLRLVAERGPASATSLERELPVSRQAIVKHLVVLSRAGLVSSQRQGQEVRYGLVVHPLDGAAAWIADIEARWDQRLERLRKLIAEDAR